MSATETLNSLRVFQGEATKEEDRLALVLPILGLYIQLYAARDLPHVRCLFSQIDKDVMFPTTTKIHGKTKVLFGNLVERAEVRGGGASVRELFCLQHSPLECP